MLQGWGKYSDWAPAFLRVAQGLIFLAQGRSKLFGGLERTEVFLAGLGFPIPGVFAVILALVEFAGGICLVLGLFTRHAAALLFIVMAVAILKVHLPHGLIGPNGTAFPLMLLVSSMALMLLGPGKASLEKTVFKREF